LVVEIEAVNLVATAPAAPRAEPAALAPSMSANAKPNDSILTPQEIVENVLGEGAAAKRGNAQPVKYQGGEILIPFQDPAVAERFSNNLGNLFGVRGGGGNKYIGPHKNGQYGVMLTTENMTKITELAPFAKNLRAIGQVFPDAKFQDVSGYYDQENGRYKLTIKHPDQESANAFAEALKTRDVSAGRDLNSNVVLGMLSSIKLQTLATVDVALGKEAGYSPKFQPAWKQEGGQWIEDPSRSDMVLVFDNIEAATAVRDTLKKPYEIGGQGEGGMKIINTEGDKFTIKLSEANIETISTKIAARNIVAGIAGAVNKVPQAHGAAPHPQKVGGIGLG